MRIINTFIVLNVLYGLSSPVIASKERNVKKRQIYREQVLPHAGGKIPDTAFETDRLLLNRLQKEGFSIPDGVILQQRSPQVHPYLAKSSRTVYHVAATIDGRYTPVEGRYKYSNTPSIETTYLYPQIHNYPLQRPSGVPISPKYRPFTLPGKVITENRKNLLSQNNVYLVSYQAKHPTPTFSRNYGSFTNTLPLESISWSQFQQDYRNSPIFNDFNDFYSGYVRLARSTDKDKPSENHSIK